MVCNDLCKAFLFLYNLPNICVSPGFGKGDLDKRLQGSRRDSLQQARAPKAACLHRQRARLEGVSGEERSCSG
jgi:hypothetical protein